VTGQLALAPGTKVDPKPYNAPNGLSDQAAASKSAM